MASHRNIQILHQQQPIASIVVEEHFLHYFEQETLVELQRMIILLTDLAYFSENVITSFMIVKFFNFRLAVRTLKTFSDRTWSAVDRWGLRQRIA